MDQDDWSCNIVLVSYAFCSLGRKSRTHENEASILSNSLIPFIFVPKGLVPLGKPNAEEKTLDVEPFDERTLEPDPPQEESGRLGTKDRDCNVVDVGFRNMAGVPLSIYYAGNLKEIPTAGFSCHEKYRFHMGLNPAPQGEFGK